MTQFRTIYALARELGMDEDVRRDFYVRQTGQSSLKSMTPGQQVRVLQAMQLERRRRSPGQVQGKFGSKCWALWLSGYNLGLIRNPSEDALVAFVERQTGIQQLRWLRDPMDARKAVEALKSWLGRAGVDWSTWKGDPRDDQDRIIEAQVKLLKLDSWADEDLCRQAYDAWRAGELLDGQKVEAIKLLGKTIRAGAVQ